MDAKTGTALPVRESLENVAARPPLARREPVESIVHGDRRIDHYGWLREKSNPEVLAYLNGENAYTDLVLQPTEAFQETLYQEMLGRILQTDFSVPYRLGGYLYFTRTVEGRQYPTHIRCRPEAGAPEELLLDLNSLAEGHSFFALDSFELSGNDRFLAYSTDTTGFRQYTLQIKDLEAGSILPERVNRVTSVARSGAFLLLTIVSHTTSEIHFLAASEPTGKFKRIAAREDTHEYYADHHPGPEGDAPGGVFYIRTNSGGRTFRLMAAPVADPDRKFWREVVANRPDVMLASVDTFKNHLVLFEREGGLPFLRIVNLPAPPPGVPPASHRIEFSEPAYNASLGANREFDTDQVRYDYQSFVTPRSVFDYNVRSRERTLRKQQPVLGGYDPAEYTSARLHAVAADGAKIPVSIVHRRDAALDGSAPVLLYGYGSYGISIPVNFSSNRLSLLGRGVIYAVAHIRGGGELGKPWHDAGRMQQKMNTFTDFIAAAEYLIAEKYTSPDRLIVEGGSAGGLLMGAVTNLRPDLFRAVVSHVPFVDVLNTMLDASLPLTVGEYEEWGNPQNADDYFLMKSYCPYTNLGRKDYPAILMKTGLNDSQVMYWEPAKYVAKLRTLKTDTHPLLFKVNMGAGHGGASGRYDYLREIALDYAFLLSQLGISR